MAKSNSVGTTLTINSKKVGGLTSINGVDISAETIDMTDLGNETGYREKEPGFKEAGDVTCSGFLDGEDEGQAECMTLLNSGETVPAVIKFPKKIGKEWKLQASVTRFSTGADVGNGITFELSLAVTGKPELAASGA